MDDPDAGEGELGADLSQPVHPLVQTVQQSDLEGGDQDLQGQTRKAGPGAHVQEGPVLKVGAGEQGSAVQHMELGHLYRVGDSSQVHHLVLLQQEMAVFRQLAGGLLRHPVQQAQIRQTGGNDVTHGSFLQKSGRPGDEDAH